MAEKTSVKNIEAMAKTHKDFIREVKISNDKVPATIQYTDDQVQDIKRFCCSSSIVHSTPLGFDKTFNLGDVHVTVDVFKHLAVKRRQTDDHPIFAGPMFLHGN